MKIVALLTGRGNNTLKDKNVLPVLGKPLLYSHFIHFFECMIYCIYMQGCR